MDRFYTLEVAFTEAARKARTHNRSYFVAQTSDVCIRYVAVPYRQYLRSNHVMPALYIVRPTGEIADYRNAEATAADRG
jgi:hypothetical protein